MSKRNDLISSYREEVKKFKEESNNSSFSSREELDNFFKEKIEEEGGIGALLEERTLSVIEKLEKFRRENNLKPGEILKAVKYLRLYVLTKI